MSDIYSQMQQLDQAKAALYEQQVAESVAARPDNEVQSIDITLNFKPMPQEPDTREQARITVTPADTQFASILADTRQAFGRMGTEAKAAQAATGVTVEPAIDAGTPTLG